MGENVLIIGASGDIGVSITKRLANSGYQLLLHYNSNQTVMDDLWNDIEPERILQIIQADLSHQEGITELLASIDFNVDIIIFASGKATFGLFQEMSEESIDDMLMLHVKAPLIITKQLLPGMIRRRKGRIIFITSVWGEVGASNEVLYSTVKGAQNTFVKALAKETASNGISVHAISPGFIDTKMNAELSLEERDAIFKDIPLKRPGNPDEVANTVAYLLHTGPGLLNGQIIQVSGGWMI